MSTTQQLREELADIGSQIRNLGFISCPLDVRRDVADLLVGHARQIKRDLEAAKAREAQQRAAAEREQRRAAIRRVIAPSRALWRGRFAETLVEHAIDLALEHDLTVIFAKESRANSRTRCIWVDTVEDERGYASFLHEVAHVADPSSSSRQHRHTFDDGGVVSVVAECSAWRWAAGAARCWTFSMCQHSEACLKTYAPHAEGHEERLIEDTIATLRRQVRPAPDTPAGRELKLREVERELERDELRTASPARLRQINRELDRSLAALKADRRAARRSSVVREGESAPRFALISDARKRVSNGLVTCDRCHGRNATVVRTSQSLNCSGQQLPICLCGECDV